MGPGVRRDDGFEGGDEGCRRDVYVLIIANTVRPISTSRKTVYIILKELP
jgi:hypothetical protein